MGVRRSEKINVFEKHFRVPEPKVTTLNHTNKREICFIWLCQRFIWSENWDKCANSSWEYQHGGF
jgi:hypothetical protein